MRAPGLRGATGAPCAARRIQEESEGVLADGTFYGWAEGASNDFIRTSTWIQGTSNTLGRPHGFTVSSSGARFGHFSNPVQ